jgi:hypothetical protein
MQPASQEMVLDVAELELVSGGEAEGLLMPEVKPLLDIR